MTSIRAGLALLLVAGCYSSSPQFATTPEPVQVAGPPGGGMDPAYQQGGYAQAPGGYDPNYGAPAQVGDPNAPAADPSEDPNPQYADPGADGEDPEAQPIDPNGGDYGDPSATAPVSDQDIDGTLDAYGTWEQDPDYGRVWEPDTTVVGVDFTPYETDGSWDWTSYGWTFNCDWSWGWLPFHYGRWGWFHGHWGWVPGHHWGPAWVQWRNGGGMMGWRPLAPVHNGIAMPMHDAHWRFVGERDFAKPNLRAHEFRDPAEGLRVTSMVRRPSFRGTASAHLSSIMSQRPSLQGRFGGRAGVGIGGGVRTQPGGFREGPRAPVTVYRAPEGAYRQPTYRQPTYRQPTYRQPTYRQPAYRAPTQVWRAPESSHPVWNSPARPSGGFHPSAPSYHAPSGGGGFHAPSGGGGGFHGGGGSRGGGGGGRHR